MREIKFRGRGAYQISVWYIGNLVRYDDGRLTIRENEANEFYVDPKTVGQYTGLLDSNGREIYEGDVLNNLYGHLSVSYKQEWAAFVACGVDSTGYYHEYLLDEIVNTPVRRSEIKVIGNIHDDPGLLEG